MLVKQIAITLILGRTVVFWSGLLTLTSFLFTASIGFSVLHGIKFLPFKWHPRLAITSFVLAAIHAILAFSLYF